MSAVIAGCGGSDSPSGPRFGCDSVPSCYTDALAALRACVPAPALALLPVAPMSGTINGLRCSAGEVSVAFSTFSSNPTGTVPLPSKITITTAGAPCAELSSGTGTRTDNTGSTSMYAISTIRIAGGSEVSVNAYADGAIGIACGGGDEVFAGDLEGCPSAVVMAQAVRNDNVTHMGVDLVDANDETTALFTCD